MLDCNAENLNFNFLNIKHMKRIFSSLHGRFLVFSAIIFTFIGSNAIAQTLVMPSNSPQVWDGVPSASAGVYVPGLNAAMIQYANSTNTNYLAGYACWDGGSNIFTDIMDMYAGGGATGQMLVPTSFGTPTGIPDIVIMNDPTTSPYNENFLAVIAYPTSLGIEIDYVQIQEASGAINYIGMLSPTVCTLSVVPSVVHIDAIAQYSNMSVTGFPYCQHLVVTWDNTSLVNTYGAFIDLNSIPATLTPTTIGSGITPDVAGIERTVGSGLPHELALFTYVGSGGTALWYREWDITSNTLSSAVSLDAGGSGSPISLPRIDAIDDFNNNATSALHANYKVVAQVDSGGHSMIRTYDNLLTSTYTPPHWTVSNVVSIGGDYGSGPYDHYAPAVTMGGPYLSGGTDDATQYLVTDFTHVTGYVSADILMMEPIDYTIPNYLAPLVGTTSRYYFWVSDNPPTVTSGYYANAVATPVNNPPTGTAIVVWGYPDGAGNTNIEWKPTPYGGYYGYAFKNANPGTPAPIKVTDWKIFPNPADDELTIANPAAAGVAAGYTIVDVLGKTLLAGSLQPGNQQVDLSSLAPGNYILELHRADGAGKNQLFVKE